MNNLDALYKKLLEPSSHLILDITTLEGDILILGVGGKMGPNLARVAKQAVNSAGITKRIIGVARFSEPGLQEELTRDGIETIKADLLNDDQLNELPEVKNVIYMAGLKFGTQKNAPFTWAMNVYLPGRVAKKFKNSNIVVFSSGNVYPFSPISLGGLTEDIPANPLGEYAQSCLGRERMFQYFAQEYQTPLLIYRLNYANDVSYGVLMEIAKSVYNQKEIDLSTGHVNVIWQGDANEIALRALLHCESPGKILNVTGPETISVRWVAGAFGRIFNKEPQFKNTEQPNALLSNAAACFKLFGYPRVSLMQMIDIIAAWVIEGGKTLNKETHFQERDGKY